MYLYLMTNSVNGKQYVGVTTQKLIRRRNAHFNTALRGGDTVFMRAIRKYGPEAFTLEQIGEASTWEDLMVMERDAIIHYGTLVPYGYNMTQGGEGLLGLAHTEEAKEAIGAARRGKPRDAATRIKLSEATKAYLAEHGNPMQGRVHSPETRAKIAAKAVGRQGHWLGKKMGPQSLEHRQKLSEARKGREAWNRGIAHTAETRAKMAASRTGGKNWKARAIELNGVIYPSIMDAVRATGLSRMQVSYRLQTGRARYLDKE